MTKTEARAFAAGYQEALADVLTALDAGGEAAAREWITSNRKAD